MCGIRDIKNMSLVELTQADDRGMWPNLFHWHTSTLASFREWSIASAWLWIQSWVQNPVQDGEVNKAASNDFLETRADHSKQHMNENSTCEGAVLDLFITNKPTLVRNMDTTPSISDHESAIIADC